MTFHRITIAATVGRVFGAPLLAFNLTEIIHFYVQFLRNMATVLENYAALLRETGRTTEAAKLEARAKAIRARHTMENPVQ